MRPSIPGGRLVGVSVAVGLMLGACGAADEGQGPTLEIVADTEACTPGDPCDDQDPCTSDDRCREDYSCSGDSYSCDDSLDCTTDACDGVGGCLHKLAAGQCLIDGFCFKEGESDPDNGCRECMTAVSASAWSNDDTNPCDDGNPCFDGDKCSAGECAAGNEPVACDDGNPCTADSCDPETGCVSENSSGPCDDGDGCTQQDTCADGVCAGTPVVCDDGNPCTVGDACVDGSCTPGPGTPSCDDGDWCTDDACDPASGCSHVYNHAPCDDGNACTLDDQCIVGACVGGVKACDDGNPCTIDTCNPAVAGGCVFAFNDWPCDDGDPCTLGDTCMDGACASGMGQLPCDDGNACTQDSCLPGQGCKITNLAALCDDGNACSVGDFCANGQCISGTNVCQCAKDQDCAAKDDADWCNGWLHCDTSSGNPAEWECKVDPATVVTCNAATDTACAKNACNPLTGTCALQPVNEGLPCNDNSLCTNGEKCSNGLCSGGSLISCDDADDCTADGCLPATGCTHTNMANGTACGEAGWGCFNGLCMAFPCGSLSFDGANDYIDVTDASDLRLVGTSFTVEAWVYMDDYTGDWMGYVASKLDGYWLGWRLAVVGKASGVGVGKLDFSFFSSKIVQSSSKVPLKQWSHVAGTYDLPSQSVRLWINGEQVGTATVSPVASSTSPVRLGKCALGSELLHWKGLLDDIRVSSVVRYTAEFVPSPNLAADLDTVALWRFNDGSGSTASDSSGKGHAGTLNGPTWSTEAPACIAGAVCGDGKKAAWEQCDDGNTTSGDGCASTCIKE